MSETVPLSYATAAQARAYVAAVLARPVPAGRAPRVYLITAPGLVQTPGWPKLRPAITAQLPGAELLDFADVFGPKPGKVHVTDRVPQIIAGCDGALVVPRRYRRTDGAFGFLVGDAATDEAERLTAAGLPVLVLMTRGMAAWPDVRTRPIPGARRLDLDLPAPLPAGRVLPTLAASYRALGVSLPPPPRPRPVPAARFTAAGGAPMR